MELELTHDQQMIQEMVRSFVQEELKPIVSDIEKDGVYPDNVVKKMGELGLLGMVVPEQWGGSGLDSISYAIAIEEIAKVSASIAITVSVTNSVCAYPIYAFGTEEQKERYLKHLASGKSVGGFALTEPGAGSDIGNLKCRAEKKGNSYILNGTKSWVTNAVIGDTFVVMASTGSSQSKNEISSFIVESTFKGFSFGKVEEKLGLRCSKTADIVLEDCEIPEENRLGNEGEGRKIALHTLDGSRIGVGSQALGVATAAFDEALSYAQQREAFGRALSGHQAIQFMLADMAVQIEAARLLVWHASHLRDSGNASYGMEAAMAKYYASEMVQRVTSAALQIHGAYGYSKDYNLERYFRDARVTTIYEGTSEIMKIVISRNILKNG